MAWRARPWVLALGLVLMAVAPLRAHPHVHAEALVIFVFAEGKLATVRLSWNLDAAVSAELLHHYDTNGDGRLDAAEARALAEIAAPEAAAFVDLRVGGEPVRFKTVRDFRVAAAAKRISYHFALPLPGPVDATRHVVALRLYDPSYYVALTPMAEGAVQLDGDVPPGCRHAIGIDRSTPLLGGEAYPRIVTLDCRTENGT